MLGSAAFWIDATAQRTRKQPSFAISKDNKKGDHRGRPSSIHYREITCKQLLLAVEWELTFNDTFEVQDGAGGVVVVQQRKGLPIGGHLSAAFVELVALRREYECSWPPILLHCPTTRYRDNFFVVVQHERTESERHATAQALSLLLSMPVMFERGGQVARCLELRINWMHADKVAATLAYRTDADRQGESQDVRTWPDWCDPRAPMVLQGLLRFGGKAGHLFSCEHRWLSGVASTSGSIFAGAQISHKGLAAAIRTAAHSPRRTLCFVAPRIAHSVALQLTIHSSMKEKTRKSFSGLKSCHD